MKYSELSKYEDKADKYYYEYREEFLKGTALDSFHTAFIGAFCEGVKFALAREANETVRKLNNVTSP